MTGSRKTTAAAEPVPADVQRLLEGRLSADAADVRWHARSGTRVDTGSWIGPAPLHAAVCGDRLALIAAGPRPFVLELPVAALSRAVYNHVTGELSFPQTRGRQAVPAVRLDPLAARALVACASCDAPLNPPSGTSSHA